MRITQTRLTVWACLATYALGCGRNSEPAPKQTIHPRAVADRAATDKPDTNSKQETKEAAPASPWGNLKGRFIYDGPPPTPAPINVTKDVQVCGMHNLVDESLLVGPGGGIKNVVVFVRTKDIKVHPQLLSERDVVLDNKDCRFEPHILPVLLTQTLVIKNSDPNISHNSNVTALGDVAINPLIPPGGETKLKFGRAQTIPQTVSCNIHPWMKGYVLPRDNPYVAVSGDDGIFEINDLPVGTLDFQAWQEKMGYVVASDWNRGRFELSIKPGENDLGEIKLDPKLFAK